MGTGSDAYVLSASSQRNLGSGVTPPCKLDLFRHSDVLGWIRNREGARDYGEKLERTSPEEQKTVIGQSSFVIDRRRIETAVLRVSKRGAIPYSLLALPIKSRVERMGAKNRNPSRVTRLQFVKPELPRSIPS